MAIKDSGVLSAEKVEAVFRACLFQEGEDTTDHVAAEGIMWTVGFHPGRLAQYRTDVTELLRNLPDSFRRSVGGGDSFLMSCEDKEGNQWTDSQITMEHLFQLGIALGVVVYQLPRALWSALPGGMPYLIIDL